MSYVKKTNIQWRKPGEGEKLILEKARRTKRFCSTQFKMSRHLANNFIRKLMKRGLLKRIETGRGPHPSFYRLQSN